MPQYTVGGALDIDDATSYLARKVFKFRLRSCLPTLQLAIQRTVEDAFRKEMIGQPADDG